MVCQTKEKKPAKWKVVVLLGALAVIGIWYWHESSFQQLKKNGEDIYFTEFENTELDTIIYRYDVENDEVFQVAVLTGELTRCQIDRNNQCIIGVLSKREGNGGDMNDYGIIRYDLADGSKKVCLSTKELEDFVIDNGITNLSSYEESKVEFTCDDTEWFFDLKEQQIEKKNRVQEMDINKKTVFFKEDNMQRLYLYNPEKETTRCVVAVGWSTTIDSNTGWDRSGNYLLYIKHFNKFFNASDDTIKIRNINSGAEKVLLKRKNTYNHFEFVQEM